MNWTYNFEVMSTAPSEDEIFFIKLRIKLSSRRRVGTGRRVLKEKRRVYMKIEE